MRLQISRKHNRHAQPLALRVHIGKLFVVVLSAAFRVVAQKRAVQSVSRLVVLLLFHDKFQPPRNHRFYRLGNKHFRKRFVFAVRAVSKRNFMLAGHVRVENEFRYVAAPFARKQRQVGFRRNFAARRVFNGDMYPFARKIGEIIGSNRRAMGERSDFTHEIRFARVREKHIRKNVFFAGTQRFDIQIRRKVAAVVAFAAVLRIRSRAAPRENKPQIFIAFAHFQGAHPRRIFAAPKVRRAAGSHAGGGVVIIVVKIEIHAEVAFKEEFLPA